MMQYRFILGTSKKLLTPNRYSNVIVTTLLRLLLSVTRIMNFCMSVDSISGKMDGLTFSVISSMNFNSVFACLFDRHQFHKPSFFLFVFVLLLEHRGPSVCSLFLHECIRCVINTVA